MHTRCHNQNGVHLRAVALLLKGPVVRGALPLPNAAHVGACTTPAGQANASPSAGGSACRHGHLLCSPKLTSDIMKLWTLRGTCQVNDLAGQLQNIISLRHLRSQSTLQEKGQALSLVLHSGYWPTSFKDANPKVPWTTSLEKGNGFPCLGNVQTVPSAGRSMRSSQRLG